MSCLNIYNDHRREEGSVEKVQFISAAKRNFTTCGFPFDQKNARVGGRGGERGPGNAEALEGVRKGGDLQW